MNQRKEYVQQRDQLAVFCYKRFNLKAVYYRDASRDLSEPESVRSYRRDMMHFYARLAMAGGIRGSIFKM